ncbi:MAG: lipoprotein [Pseudomonadota bacterium]|nr:lipoprotein [Pseudomonadota bacterium]
MRILCAASLLILLLSACGLKGPLYLPQEQAPPQSPQSQPSQGEEKKK